MKIIYQSTATDDLYKIFFNTADIWGRPQARKYLAGIYKAIDLAAKHQKVWRKYADFNEDAERPIYYVSYKRHFVFFEIVEEENIMAVLAVLYDAMDIPNRLQDVIVSVGRDSCEY